MANTDIDAIIQSLTLEEKVRYTINRLKTDSANSYQVSLLAGRNFSETVGYPEKGVPSIKVSSIS